MGRLNFGGAQDMSGVFASLIQRRENQIEQGVASAKARALAEQAAQDQEKYAQWKAGKISDDEWLAYIAMRRDQATDPEERAKYAELFLEHEGAIKDAQVEADFAIGKLSVGSLMNHYRKRMASVEKDSPAYREMATRYGELLRASQSAASGGGGGGGRRRGSGGGASAESVVSASIGALKGSDTGTGFDTSGRDVIDPVNSMVPYEDDDDFIDGLRADLERIDSINKILEENPDIRVLTDPLTGEQFEATPDFLSAMDRQYLRTEQAVAAAYWARGESGDALKATQALGYMTTYIAGAMQDHATLKLDPSVDQLEQSVFTTLVAASAITDPAERRKEYAKALRAVNRFSTKYLTVKGSDLPPEQRPEDSIYDRVQNLEGLLDLGANGNRYSPEEINGLADQILSRSASLGEEGGSVSLKTLLEGSGEDSTDVPSGFVGVLENLDQERGLIAGEALMAGQPIEGFEGPYYVYQYDGKTTTAVVADSHTVVGVDGTASLQLRPKGELADDLVMSRVKVGGKAQTVWIAPKPLEDPRYRVYRVNHRIDIGDTEYEAGDLIRSSDIADLGGASLAALVRSGDVAQESFMQAVEMPDGNTWFRDNETGMFHLELPFTVNDLDPTTGGLRVDDDGEVDVNYTPFAAGVMVPFAGVRGYEMERWVQGAIAAGLINPALYQRRGAAGEVEPIDSLEGMYVPPFQPGPRPVNPRMQDILRARTRSSEEEFMQAPLTARYQFHGTTQAQVNEDVAERTRRTAEQLGVILGSARPTNEDTDDDGLTALPSRAGAFMPTGNGEGVDTSRILDPFGIFSAMLANPRIDAQQASESRRVVLGKKIRMPDLKEIRPDEVALAPPPLARAPLPVMKPAASRTPLPGEHLATGKLPTSDTPSLIRTTDPRKGAKEIL